MGGYKINVVGVVKGAVSKRLGYSYRSAGLSMMLLRLHVPRALGSGLLLHLLCLCFFPGKVGWHGGFKTLSGDRYGFLKITMYLHL